MLWLGCGGPSPMASVAGIARSPFRHLRRQPCFCCIPKKKSTGAQSTRRPPRCCTWTLTLRLGLYVYKQEQTLFKDLRHWQDFFKKKWKIPLWKRYILRATWIPVISPQRKFSVERNTTDNVFQRDRETTSKRNLVDGSHLEEKSGWEKATNDLTKD